MSLRSESPATLNTSYNKRHMQSACNHIRTRVVGFENREQFRSAMLLTKYADQTKEILFQRCRFYKQLVQL